MTPLTGYSIWLMPTGIIYEGLSNLINQLARQHESPAFIPHVTLLGDLDGSEKDVINLTQLLARRIRPFRVTLTHVGMLDEYFRCIFLRAEETPALLEANQEARSIFQREQDPKFMPHLSLMYGHFAMDTQKKIIDSLDLNMNESFSIKQIHLFSTRGEPYEWRRIQPFDLAVNAG